MNITHSLTSRPSSMRVGDSRWPLRYLPSPLIIIIIRQLIRRRNMSIKSLQGHHCARSCDISFSWMYLQPVHSSMLCIHCLLGLPWCRNPSMIPSRTAIKTDALKYVQNKTNKCYCSVWITTVRWKRQRGVYGNTKIIEVANMSKMKWSGLNC